MLGWPFISSSALGTKDNFYNFSALKRHKLDMWLISLYTYTLAPAHTCHIHTDRFIGWLVR